MFKIILCLIFIVSGYVFLRPWGDAYSTSWGNLEKLNAQKQQYNEQILRIQTKLNEEKMDVNKIGQGLDAA